VEPDLRRHILRKALSARLAEASRNLSPGSRPLHAAAAGDTEEALRVLMVRLMPRVQQGVASSEELDSFLSALASLADAARSGDLRFLDAWNSAYEALGHGQAAVELDGFRRAYVDLLEHHLDGLDG
jgi:hypothetical protein